MFSAQQEGVFEGRGLGPGAQQASPCLSGQESTGHVPFCSFAPFPHHFPQGLPHRHWTPNSGWVPLGVGTPPLPSPSYPSRLLVPEVWPLFLLPFPPSHTLRTRTAGGDLGGQRIRPGISAGSWGPTWAGETWPHSLLILCPQRFPFSPFGHGNPSSPPATPQGCQSCLASTSPSPSLPRTPHVLPSHWGFVPFP